MPSYSVDFISTCRGETAIGKGSKLPLVISTSIKAYKEFKEIKYIIKAKKKIFHITLLTFLLD